MAELVSTEKSKQESKRITGFNLDLMVAFDYTEEKGKDEMLDVDFAVTDPNDPGKLYRKSYFGKEAKALAKYFVDLSREIRVPYKVG